MSAASDKQANFAAATRLVREAAAAGATLVVLPEVFNWRGPSGKEVHAAETIPGPTTQLCGALARELRIHLIGGSILERSGTGGKAWNSSCVFSPTGDLVATYRKIHLFDADLPGRIRVRESDTRAHGSDTIVVRTRLAPIGLSICYDLRFPELYRGLVRDGATVVTVPSAFTAATGRDHWEPLLRARAIENQVYVLAANQFGANPHGFEDHGHSMIVDPWGNVLACAPDGEAIVRAPVDLDRLVTIRRELPCLDHMRLR